MEADESFHNFTCNLRPDQVAGCRDCAPHYSAGEAATEGSGGVLKGAVQQRLGRPVCHTQLPLVHIIEPQALRRRVRCVQISRVFRP